MPIQRLHLSVRQRRTHHTMRLDRGVRWLLAFYRMSLTDLSRQGWGTLRDQLTSFEALAQTGPRRIYPVRWLDQLLADEGSLQATTGDARGPRPPAHMRRTEIRQLQRQLRACVDDLLPPAGAPKAGEIRLWAVPLRRVALASTRDRVSWVCAAAWPDIFWAAALSLIDAYGARLRRCPQCRTTLFLKRKRQTYCSSSCSQRARSGRWYARHREEAQRRRRFAYARRIRAAYPKAVIGQRTS